ncbi:DNA topoisomerase IB [Caulobacter sp. NIBR2454]|uniref:DNA topoisomerase IB n=1 Tax=Caulobacter sp. NIBR2454 TaxID=3015996 RepID=UPI0022B6626A|nr:DNA topoisomerase IB [Caulobacter sp. NIBR2454]
MPRKAKTPTTPQAFAKAAGLTYVNDSDPGLSRVKTAKGFAYRDAKGGAIKDAAVIDRIDKLAIPPAWTEVWICARADGHIQAVGRDARGRKQYRYHADWRSIRDDHKYGRTIAFGRALPKLRRRLEEDLAKRGLPREKVLAAVVSLLEQTLIRVGNAEYARTNKSFGLTTMRDRHVTLTGAGATFEFRGKSGVLHRTGFQDRRLARIVRACQDLPGQRLFQYEDENGERRPVESADVNAYLREAMGDDFTAKDFRTWAGTLAMAEALSMQPEPTSQTETKQIVNLCVKAVAGVLGNTAAVCRKCYIHPAVFDAFTRGDLAIKPTGERRDRELKLLKLIEAA